MGTFNVNDQMPTQDLGGWLGAARERGKVERKGRGDGEGVRVSYEKVEIPPLDEISPFSMGMSIPISRLPSFVTCR